jgi:hypothetical protein
MDEAEAIRLAVPVMKTHPLSHLVDYTKPRALYLDMIKCIEEERQKRPHMEFNFPVENHWVVSFPLFEVDRFGRESLRIQVCPVTKVAKIVLDL